MHIPVRYCRQVGDDGGKKLTILLLSPQSTPTHTALLDTADINHKQLINHNIDSSILFTLANQSFCTQGTTLFNMSGVVAHAPNGSSSSSSSSFVVRQLSAENGFPRTNDEVHSKITFCPVMEAVLGTSVLQRLRYLKQLATADRVYMNANHVRFEHSMGVAKIAEDSLREIRDKQQQLHITDKDVLCVKLAGLCHDLGHGPYSHIYDNVFLKMIRTQNQQNPAIRHEYERTFGPTLQDVPEQWEHEDASLMMIDAFLAELGLAIDVEHMDEPLKQIGNGVDRYSMRVFQKYEPPLQKDQKPPLEYVLTSRDFVFIKECIIGKPLTLPNHNHHSKIPPGQSGFLGRPAITQEFLYDIISNRHNGLDVDKIDYFARDERRAMRSSGEIESRMVDEAVVAWGDCPRPDKCFRCRHQPTTTTPGKHLMICYPAKMISEISQFFDKRFALHKTIYQHKTSIGASILICDILVAADPYFPIPTFVEEAHESFRQAAILGDPSTTTVPRSVPISRAMMYKGSYLRLRDDVVSQIMATTQPELQKARELCWRFQTRDLYKCPVKRNLDLWKEEDDTTSIQHKVDQEIDNMTEEAIEEAILNVHGTHEGTNGQLVVLERHDIVVKKNEFNHGAKDANPLPRMRFVEKKDLSRSSKPVMELPEAFAPNVGEHRACIPQAFSHKELLVYCRSSSPDKVDLTRHQFEQWIKNLESQYEEGLTATTTTTLEYGGGDTKARLLTQDDMLDVSTPHRPPPQPHYDDNDTTTTTTTTTGNRVGVVIRDDKSPLVVAPFGNERKRRKLEFPTDSP